MRAVAFDFSDNNYIVTGASAGMGMQVAKELAEAGANVLAIARRKEKLEKLKSIYPERITVGIVDVCQTANVERCISEFVGKHGKLSGLVHAAGLSGITPIKSYDILLAQNIMNINFWAGLELMRIFYKKKYSKNDASTVLFSSVAAVSSAKGMFVYSASKAALNTAVKSISKEISKRGHRINTILPGWVDTDMTRSLELISDKERLLNKELLGIGKASDVSGMVLFLLSDRANWITGTMINVDGGFLA